MAISQKLEPGKVLNLSSEQQLLFNDGKLLPIMEEFYTIQGEGFQTGKAAYFIRIGGCDVGCHWCDVKESWNPELHPLKSVDDVVANAGSQPGKAAVITGGEPSLYNLDYLTSQLKANGVQTYIETAGSNELTGTWHWVCLSPKKTAPPVDSVYSRADELKMIIYNKNDFAWAEEHAERVGENCKLFLQPEWSKISEMMPIIVDYVMNNPKWNISLQAHKYMNIP